MTSRLSYSRAALLSLRPTTSRDSLARKTRRALWYFGILRETSPAPLMAKNRPSPSVECPQRGLPRTSSQRTTKRPVTIGWLNAQSLTNKAEAIKATIEDYELDVLAITETWHSANDDIRLRLATPHGYTGIDVPRSAGRGGGVAIIYRQELKCSPVALPPFTSFEAVCAKFSTRHRTFILLNVYRPGSVRAQRSFFEDLTSVFETLITYSCPVIVGGDFNIQVQDAANVETHQLQEILTNFDLTQHVSSPTHRCGGTLDLIMTPTEWPLEDIGVDPPGVISDHSLVRCSLPIATDPLPLTTKHQIRSWRNIDQGALRSAIEGSVLCQPVSADTDIDDLVATYQTVLQNISDQLAPLHTVRHRASHRAPWFDEECRDARRVSRRYERRYRKSGNSSDRCQ